MWYGLPLHMISMNSSSNLSLTYFSSGVSVFKHAPGTLKILTSRPSYASTTKVVISDSKDIVGDKASSLGIYPLCLLPSAHVLPLILPYSFSLVMFTALSDIWFCSGVSTSGFSGPKNSYIILLYIPLRRLQLHAP